MAADLNHDIGTVVKRRHIEVEQRGQADYLANQQRDNQCPA